MNSLAFNQDHIEDVRINNLDMSFSKKTESGLRIVKETGHRKLYMNGTGLNRSANTNCNDSNNIGIAARAIASDYNNILAGIIENINLALSEADKENPSSIVLELAQRASHHAETMIVKLADLSKPSRTRKSMVFIGKLIKQSVSAKTRGTRIDVKTNIPNDIFCRVDKTQISTVFDNIITNSVQSISNSGLLRIKAKIISLNLGNHLSLLPGNYLKISFHDNGGGISQGHIKRVFDPFFTTKSAGRGLGLTSALSVVNEHHGQIEVESISGLGTTVNVYIPL